MNSTLIENFSSLSEALNSLNADYEIPSERKYNSSLDMQQTTVGWNNTTSFNTLVQMLFTDKTVNVIQEKVSNYLQGVSQKGNRIIPSKNVVVTALNGVFQNHIPRIGDIYGRYLVVDQTIQNDYAYIVDKTISLLVRGIRTDIEMAEQNYKLNIWDSVLLGDDNPQGLRQHSTIKLRERGPDRMLFNMKY
jgi:hypothetical protein